MRSVFVAAALTFWAWPGTAQVVEGRMLDSLTHRPIAGGAVLLRDTLDREVAREPVTPDGRFRIRAHSPGVYRLQFVRIGYRTVSSPLFRLGRDSTVTHTFRIPPIAIALEDLHVTGEATERHLEWVGFYDRQRMGFGHFLERPEIERRLGGVQVWTQLLSAVPGVRLLACGDAPFGCAIEVTGMQSFRGSCRPRVIVDGMLWYAPDGFSIGPMSDVVLPENIAAIEVYRRPAELPAQYGGAESGCGVILIWTRKRP